MSNIRVTYSGLISIAIGIISIVTGTIFTLIVTRQLLPEEFGTWSLIGSLISYVLIIEPIIAYWSTRETARGIESGKTAVVSTGIFSCAGLVGYILIALIVGNSSDADLDTLLFAIVLVPFMFFNRILTAINLGWKPHAASYGILTFEVIKIPSALLLVYFLDLGVHGAILATTLAYVGSIITLVFFAKDKLRGKIQIKFLKKWLKSFWLTLYPGFSILIPTLDVTVFLIITGNLIGIAYYFAALAISAFVGQSGLISQAIYSKLLGGGEKSSLQENIIYYFYFSFPLASISIMLAKPGLFALNPIYEVAAPLVIILTVRTFIYTLGRIFDQSLQGLETVDMNENYTFRSLLGSKLFWLPSVRLIKYVIYVAVLILMLIFTKDFSQIEIVSGWALIALIIEIPFMIYLKKLVWKNFQLMLPKKRISIFLIASIIGFGIPYFLMQEFLTYQENIIEFLPSVLIYPIIGVLLYLVITFTFDNNTRQLMKLVINEILRSRKI